ncbi:transcription termination factor 2 isoform X2 [Tiliqua scincoides]|uniref:transcription termination factor 2 isoform X2 n=1 Tax=Tiliqua scincoides TaxID=71010 RepID=UPI003462E362
MEKVLCSVHGLPCVLKTGVRDGPNKGKSFYLCGVQNRPSCGFQLSTDLCPSYCLMHVEHVVDLQALIQQQEAETYRLLYRCDKAKLEGKKWCGSVPWQDSKTIRLSTKPQSQRTLESLLNHRDQRNPFKIPGKSHDSLSLKQGNDSEDKKLVKKEKENREVLDSDKRDQQKLSEFFRKELLSGIKTEHQQFGEEKSASRERIETQIKSCKSAIEMEKPIRYGSSKMFETSGHIRKDSTVRSTEDVLQNGVKPKQSLPVFNSHTSNTEPLNEEQLGKGELKSCRDKAVAVKTNGKMSSDGTIEEKKCTGLPAVPPKGNPEEQPALFQTGIDPQEITCPSKDASSDVFVPRKLPVELSLPQEKKVHHQKNLSSISQEVLQKKAIVNSRNLHSHLTAQLRQKKNTLKMVNLKSLPDKGERILKQVQELEAALSSLNLESKDHVKEGDVSSIRCEELPQNPFGKSTIKQPDTVGEGGPQSFQDHHAGSSLELHPPLQSSQPWRQPSGESSHGQALYGGRMTEDRLRAVYNATTDAINQIHKSLESCPTEETVSEDPAGLKVSLLPHQKQALAWLLWRENQKPCGGILADDMGLGKTLTMIALILAQKLLQKERGEKKKLEIWLSRKDPFDVVSHGTLIVCPASLIHHWKKEVERHVRSGKLKVCLYHGPSRNKNTTALSEFDIVVTTYSILAKEIPTQKEEAEVAAEDFFVQDKSLPFSPLLWIKWARIILDEAHSIRNPKVQASIAACKLRATARWAVTGTPIQNNLLDMYSLLRFLRCSPFDEFKVWKSQVDNQTKKGGERLTILTRSLLLRRTKNQLDSSGKPLVTLPQRSTHLHRLKLSDDEQSVYDVLFARSRSTLQSYLKRQEDRCGGHTADNPFDKAQQFRHGQPDSFEKTNKDAPPVSTTVHILSLLLRLRQCCCHLSLLKVALDQANLNSEGISLSLEEQLNALTLSEPASDDAQSTVYLFGTAFSVDLFETTRQSTKLSHLLEKLKAIQVHSQKSVIVSQWTSMLKVVAVHLEKLGLKYATVDGSVNPKQRMDVVEEFNNNPKGPQVMLISLLAGGVGLNLVGGNHLFLLDMHWNPALEDQACDRIYRVGQRNNVTIHRFVCEGTVEEKISDLQTKKKELAQKVLSGREDSFTKLNLADLKLLFGI